jgi:hypothetical protein
MVNVIHRLEGCESESESESEPEFEPEFESEPGFKPWSLSLG